MTGTQERPAQPDATSDFLTSVIGAVLGAILVALVLPLAVPWLTTQIAGYRVAKRHAFWITHRWQWAVNTASVVIVAAVLAVEAILIGRWIAADGPSALVAQDDWWATAWAAVWPWLLLNLFLGVLLLPVAWSIRRRQLADMVRDRTIPDVVTQERIEAARKRAADIVSARKVGMRLDPATGQLSPVAGGAVLTAPHPVGSGRLAFGLVTHNTVRTLRDRMIDQRRVPDWIDDTGRYAVLPTGAGATRAYIVAESGVGKTVLINGLILPALDQGWRVVFLDAKGDIEDAEKLAAIVSGRGRSVRVGEPWNMFTGSTEQITTKLMRLMPAPDGANQYYLDEIRAVLQAIQGSGPVTGMRDLFGRLSAPAAHVSNQMELEVLTQPIDKMGTTRISRVQTTLLTALRPLEPFLSSSGWSYGDGAADLTIVPLSPVEEAQAKLGDLLLTDLRGYLATRLARRDKSPMLVVIDEFPQLVTGASDPGDSAGMLFETSRSAGAGLVLAGQSIAGLSNDETRRRRALSSGAALIFGRSKDPEDVVKYAGTVMRMEASGAAAGDELRSARAQHTYVVPPQDVREASQGSFWIVQGGAIAPFRSFPSPTAATPAAVPVAPAEDAEPVVDDAPAP